MALNLVGAVKQIANTSLETVAKDVYQTFALSLNSWQKEMKEYLSVQFALGANRRVLESDGFSANMPFSRSGDLRHSTRYRITPMQRTRNQIKLTATVGFEGIFRNIKEGVPYPLAISQGNYSTKGWLDVAFRFAEINVIRAYKKIGIGLRRG